MPRRPPEPLQTHRACEELTRLSMEHLPRDGSVGRPRRWRKGATVWAASDRADRVYFLERGQISVMRPNTRGRDVIVQVINPGEPFGELCFCAAEDGRFHSRALAVSESAGVEIGFNAFLQYLRQNSAALTSLAFGLCTRLSDAEQRIEVLAHRGAEARLGKLLLQLATRDRPPAAAGEVSLDTSQDQLARMSAMSRPHVTVVMGAFRRQGLVRYGRGQPLTVNTEALKVFLERAASA